MLAFALVFLLFGYGQCQCTWSAYTSELDKFGDLKLICEVEKLQEVSHIVTRDLINNPSFSERTVSLFVVCGSSFPSMQSAVSDFSLKRLTRLSDITIHGCQINNLQQDFFKFLKTSGIKSLNLSRNDIRNIENFAFETFPDLEILTLDNNELTTIQKEVFKHLIRLKTLSLSNNKLGNIDIGAFDKLISLQILNVDNNEIVDINGVFNGLVNLRSLTLSQNRISLFDFSFLPKNLEQLDMRRNEISEIGNYFELQGQLSLKSLDMSFNLIQSIKDLNVPNQVQNLILNHNRISEVAQNTFVGKLNLTRIDLTWNQLKHLDISSFWLSPLAHSKPSLYLGNNPLVCDCSLEWLPRLINSATSQPELMDASDVECELVDNQGTRSLLEMRKDEFLCSYESHCFALCHCCDFDACDCEMACPAGCVCYHDNPWANNYVQCSNTGSSVLPANVPMDVTHLALDGNQYSQMKSHSFIGRKNLKSLFLNSSQINSLQNRTFHGLANLEILHLEDNFLKKIYSWDFESLESLKEIYLQNNQIQTIFPEAFSHIRNLQILNLVGNELTNLPDGIFISNPKLEILSLNENPWTCGCNLAMTLNTWTDNSPLKLEQSSLIFCTNELGVFQSMLALTEICDSGEALVIYSAPSMPNLVPITIAVVLTVVLFALMIAVFVVIRRRAVKGWLVSRWAAEKQDFKKSKMFDLCVCYSLKDEHFVTQILCPVLENGEQRGKIYMQHRDGGASPEQNLHIAAASCAKILIIGSNAFLETEWDRPETRKAISSAILIAPTVIVLLDDDVDTELNKTIKNSTVLVWGSDRFWPTLIKQTPPSNDPRKTAFAQKEPCHSGAHMTCNFQYPSSIRHFSVTPNQNCNTLCIHPQSTEHVYMSIDEPVYHCVHNNPHSSFNRNYTMRSDYRDQVCEQFCCVVTETMPRHTGQKLIMNPQIISYTSDGKFPAYIV
ncbi:toll-like receptor Tollo [Artemia franciscana]|uniref:TIR domain-containing protein n=1 Tax=Artemia franciscana TaxID=6661 RepID=A0AA88HNJ4_ARTSF|nr:hypothetical protein QYM36_009931 [Artemia franciscana]